MKLAAALLIIAGALWLALVSTLRRAIRRTIKHTRH